MGIVELVNHVKSMSHLLFWPLSLVSPLFSFVLYKIILLLFSQVSNAREELLEWYAANGKDNSNIIHACERCAGGIIEAIGHFKLGPKLSPRDVSDFLECKADNVNPGHAVVEFFLFYERWRRGEIENCAAYTKSLKASCVSRV